MCGIAGLLRFDGSSPDLNLLSRMGSLLRHRGPENEGVFVDRGSGFVHRRLKIIDIETGDQPLFNRSRTIMAMLNGEIYNYREIRKRLEKAGAEFLTQGDTE